MKKLLIFAIKSFLKISLMFAVCLTANKCATKALQVFTASHTYVQSVDLPTLNTVEALRIIQEFNYMSGGTAIKYSGIRPIIIKEAPLIDAEGSILGIAYPGFNQCTITLAYSKIKTKEQYRDVLLHELVHCYFYEHSDAGPEDLMNSTNEQEISEDNRRKWSEKLKVLVNG